MPEHVKEKIRAANTGRKMPEEQRRRLSELHTGKQMSEEAKRKMSENNARYWQGKKRDPETVEKIRQSQTGKTISEEHRRKISQSTPREYISECKKKPVWQMDLDGTPIKLWPSAKEAELAIRGCLSGCVSACCKGKWKTAFGYKWKYSNDKESIT